jgi:osmotically-inducible protein OsmY
MDEQIKLEIVDHLAADFRVDAADVLVEVSDGEVTLKGSVPSYAARQAATGVAWEIVGVKRVTNLLSVLFPATFSVPSDEEIENSARMTLSWNPDVYSVDVDVSVMGGVVKLTGIVDAYWKKWKAENLVADLTGVTDVENHLAVVPSESRVDKEIAEDIEDALERSLYIHAGEITVRVNEGKVRLTGSVPTYHGRERAYDAAVNVSGVIDVDNDIVVV